MKYLSFKLDNITVLENKRLMNEICYLNERDNKIVTVGSFVHYKTVTKTTGFFFIFAYTKIKYLLFL